MKMGKCVLVTGGSRGIGRATVNKFLDEGWSVITTSTSGEVDIDSPNLEVYMLDLSKPSSIDEFCIGLQDRQIHTLVNNAGIAGDFNELSLDTEILRQVLEVNLIRTAELTESMLKQHSELDQIINVSSSMGAFSESPMDGYVPSYRVSKAALNMYTRCLSAQNKGEKSVCAYEPGWVKTDMGGSDAPRLPGEPAEEIYRLVIDGFKTGGFYGPEGLRDW